LYFQEEKKMDFSFIVIVLQLIFLEGILSIDNAAVLGAMVTPLSEHEPIPWPKRLTGFGHAVNKLLGPQRTAALKVGLIGAYAGRGIMLVAASYIIQNPWLKLIGAAYLIKLALDDLSAHGYSGGDETSGRPVQVRTFWSTVLAVELMDLAFSLDNVVAAVSLSDKLWVVMLGVAIGIVLMRFAAGVFSKVIEKAPILKTAAYILVLNIGVELLIEDLGHVHIGDWTRFGISVATILLALAYERFRFMKFFRPLLIWLSQGFALVNGMITWVFAPLKGLLSLFMKMIQPRATKPSSAG